MRVLAALLLCLTMSAAAAPGWLSFERPRSGVTRPQFFLQEPAPDLPEISLDAKDIIRILSVYNIDQQKSPTFCQQLHGLTNFNRSSIELCSEDDPTQRQETLIHELLHVRYHEVGIETGGPAEPTVEQHAQAIFHALFGLSAPPTAAQDPSIPQPQ